MSKKGNNEFDIFSKDEIDINSHKEEERRESVIYSPKAKDTPDGIYNAKIRFLYNPNDPVNGSIIKKIVYYLKDSQDRGHYFDSPQSIGDWNSCPIGQLWKQLSNSESAIDQKNAKELNRRKVFYSLVYIIEDKQNPELEGKIKIFKYGLKIKAKLDRYLEPKSGPKIDIMNFYSGYNFDLTITRQNNYNNYDEAAFELKPSIIPVKGLSGKSGDRDILKDLMENAPDLDEYKYKPWSDADRAKLESILNQYRSPGDHISTIVNDSGEIEDSDDKQKSTKTKTNKSKSEKEESSDEEKKEVSVEDDLDSFLDELDA